MSRASSRVGSLAASRVVSRAVSRRGSLFNPSDSLSDTGIELPDTFDHLKRLTDNQEALMSFNYKDSSSQVGSI